MINVLVCGINGKMGKSITELIAAEKDMQSVCGIDLRAYKSALPPVYASFDAVCEKVDVIIDFSSPAVLKSELDWATKHNCPVVLAATGYTESDLKLIEATSKKLAVFKTGNFSLGINLLVKLVKQAALALGEGFDIEIIEKHHNHKVDAPSGTAIMLAESANSAFDNGKPYVNGRSGITGKRGNEIGVHAVRGGTIVGEHDVIFAGKDETITLSHTALSRKIFAVGAFRAAGFLLGAKPGLYTMRDALQ